MRAIKRFFRKLIRSTQYAIFSWSNEDWDYAYTWRLFEFKLKRVKIALEKGYGTHEPAAIAALEEAIVICGQLSNEFNFAEAEDAEHRVRWGELEMEFIKTPGSKYSTAKFSYPNAPTDELKEQATKESIANTHLAHVRQIEAIKRFGAILSEHSTDWWD